MKPMRFSFHPAYGLTDEFRAKVVQHYLKTGDSGETAERFNVSKSSVYEWTKNAMENENAL